MLEIDPNAPLTVVGLSLVAALAWGTSDFGGGFLGRRGPVLGVLLFTQGLGCLFAAVAVAVRGEALPTGTDLALTVLAGGLASIGVGSFYAALAIGRMGIVAPVAAVMTALTPAVVGMALEGVPSIVVIAGMALAVVAVVVVSASPDEGAGPSAGLALAVLGGVTLGLLGVVLSRVSRDYVFGPLAIQRAIQVTVFAVAILATRRSWRMPRPTWRLIVAVGIIDLTGNVAFLVASRTGALAIAAMVSSLYPVVTVLLAASILRERMTRSHAAGVAIAGVAIALIAGGSS